MGSLTNGFEKRRIDRRQLYFYLRIMHDADSEPVGYLADISTRGLMMLAPEKVDVDQAFRFRIALEKELEMAADLVFEARSLWCEKDANPDYYIIGFKFIDLNQEGVDIVNYLTGKYGFEK
ncbi:MAG: PilZ domain-containing protein [Desulfobacterales bacterium]|nr:PilZ domain-containing protein [Desulfobacterales bacterium]